MFFRNININDRNRINQFLQQEDRVSCEYCFADIFIWREKYNTQFCIEDDVLYIRQFNDETQEYFYYLPMSNKEDYDVREGIDKIIIDSIDNDYKFSFGGLNNKSIGVFKTYYVDVFDIEYIRDYSDYIYNSKDLIGLSGKRFHKKKNLINKFKREYEGCYSYRSITKEDKEKISIFNKLWCDMNESKDMDDLSDESIAINEAMRCFDELDMKGIMLYVDDKMIAYTLGCEGTKDVMVVQIEKALSEYVGAYQMINNLFATEYARDYKYINREEDLGIEGMRKAKLSYRPEYIDDFYVARPHIRKLRTVSFVKGIMLDDKIC